MAKLKIGDGVRVRPFDLWYNTWGAGPTKLLFIMGMNATHHLWEHQIWWFGEELGDEYTVLSLDNRGIGNSDAPSGLYSTSEMAKDTLELLEYLKWTRVHVTGVSLGGMIAQELALMAPNGLIASLCLTSTHAGTVNPIPSVHAMVTIPRSFMVSEFQRPNVLYQIIFHPKKLNGPVPLNKYTKAAITKLGDVQLVTFFDFIKAMRLSWTSDSKPQPAAAALSQLWASLTHRVSPARLQLLKDSGIPIIVVTGTWDKMVHPYHSHYLAKVLECKIFVYEETGHAVPVECVEEYNIMLKDHVDAAEKAAIEAEGPNAE
ncbi:Alpha/Beta hydrolase protein [Cladochytrium replicatum]|nr:Alpha/Beta hydrolase protein [Cladochytrium replicatum]